MSSSKPSQIWPGCTSASAAVLRTQPRVTTANRRFLAACRSAQAPRPGMVTITSRYDRLRPVVHSKVAHEAPPATPPTKYAANTAVMTTVV